MKSFLCNAKIRSNKSNLDLQNNANKSEET